MGLEMKTQCETCREPLPHDAAAFICSYECTFCRRCTEATANACPNCGGELARRPRRAARRE